MTGVSHSQRLGDHRLRGFALGNLGALYESEHRYGEALLLTRRAIRAATQAESTESLYRWHWQAGRILWAQGEATAAIAAYRRAVENLEETRQEALAHYGSAELRFRRRVAPVYLDLIDALMQGSDMVGDEQRSLALLLGLSPRLRPCTGRARGR